MKIDLQILNQYVKDGWVERNDHPSLPISIYNYSRNTQYEKRWDDITKMCRGLILDNEGNVVAKAFDKFFNMEEHTNDEIPNEPFEVFEKMDGSLGILFNYNKEWILATKGSFTSDQAVKGMEILKKYRYNRLLEGYTYLFEIIYPENRIVCNYDFEDLILLSVIDNKDGYELRIHDDTIHLEGNRFRNIYLNLGFKMVKKYDGIKDYNSLKEIIAGNQEGFVIRFQNGFRMKIKGEEYVRLHRILTGFSNVDIWEYLKDEKNFSELLEKVPDEFDMWVRETAKDLTIRFENIKKEYTWIYEHILRVENSSDRKVFAELAKIYNHPSILFSMLDGRDYSNYIWRTIRPKYSKPFWQKETE